MKLDLINFRSFSRASFRFDSKYTLISGPSGSGKTSIFMAMHFAISGEGKKVVKNGTTKCSVVLEMENIKITRTKGPCRLIVDANNVTYEDAEAQAMINGLLPHWELGYVSQRMYKSFVYMTPADKLVLIEKMAFSGTNICDLQNRCKSMVLTRRNILADAKKERDTIEKILTNIGCAEEIEQDSNEIEQALVRTRTEASLVLSQLDSAKRNKKKKQFLLCQLEEINREMNQPIGEYDLQELITKRDQFNRYTKLKQQLDEKTQHSGMTEKEIDVCIQDMNRLKTIQLKLLNLAKLRNELLIREEFKKTHAVHIGECPECNTDLSSWNGKLFISTNEMKNITIDESEVCEQQLNKLKADISILEELEKDREEILNLYDDDVDADHQLKNLLHLKQNDKIWEACIKEKCENPSNELITKARDAENLKFNRKKNQDKIEQINTTICQLDQKLENVELLSTKLDRLYSTIKNLEEIRKSIEIKKQWDIVRTLREVERDMELKLPSAVRLASLIKTAEHMALEEILENINIRVGIYLQRILPSVTANIVFEAKNVSEKVDIKIYINDMPTDVNSLSGGEFARLAIVFAIAMAEMNNVDTLFLDESFASLDSDSTETVLDAIKDNYFGKVIVIAHQTTKGVFDEVVEL